MNEIAKTRGRVVRQVVVVLVLGGLLAAATSVLVLKHTHDEDLAAQRSTIAALHHRIDQSKRVRKSTRHRVVHAVLGVRPAQVTRDTRTLKDLMSLATGWNSGASYDQVRSTVMKRYSLGESSSLMTTLLPAQAHSVDATGHTYYYLDSIGATSRLVKLAVTPLGVRATKRRYLVDATIARGTTTLDHERLEHVLVTAIVDGAGHIVSLTASAPSGISRNSGER